MFDRRKENKNNRKQEIKPYAANVENMVSS